MNAKHPPTGTSVGSRPVDRDHDPLAFFVGFSFAAKISLIFWLGIAVAVAFAR